MAQAGVEHRRETEPDADRRDRARDALGRQVDNHAERLEHVGRPALAGRRAVAVLDDLTS